MAREESQTTMGGLTPPENLLPGLPRPSPSASGPTTAAEEPRLPSPGSSPPRQLYHPHPPPPGLQTPYHPPPWSTPHHLPPLVLMSASPTANHQLQPAVVMMMTPQQLTSQHLPSQFLPGVSQQLPPAYYMAAPYNYQLQQEGAGTVHEEPPKQPPNTPQQRLTVITASPSPHPVGSPPETNVGLSHHAFGTIQTLLYPRHADWRHSLYDCFSDDGTLCAVSCLCPGWLFGQICARLGLINLFAGVALYCVVASIQIVGIALSCSPNEYSYSFEAHSYGSSNTYKHRVATPVLSDAQLSGYVLLPIGSILYVFILALLRHRLRVTLQLSGSIGEDCITAAFCGFCAMVQMGKEVDAASYLCSTTPPLLKAATANKNTAYSPSSPPPVLRPITTEQQQPEASAVGPPNTVVSDTGAVPALATSQVGQEGAAPECQADPPAYQSQTGDWNIGLFDCCQRPKVCVMGTCCLCLSYTQISARAGAMTVLPAFVLSTLPFMLTVIGCTLSISGPFQTTYNYYVDGAVVATWQPDFHRYEAFIIAGPCIVVTAALLSLILLTVLRGRVREKFKIQGNRCSDCCSVAWCCPCAVTQMGIEVGMYDKFSCWTLAPLPTTNSVGSSLHPAPTGGHYKAKKVVEAPTPEQVEATHELRKKHFYIGAGLWTSLVILAIGLALGFGIRAPSLFSFGSGPVVTSIAGSPWYRSEPIIQDGTTYRAAFYEPLRVAVNSAGTIYVVDASADTTSFDSHHHDQDHPTPGHISALAATNSKAASSINTTMTMEADSSQYYAVLRKVTPAGKVSTVPLSFKGDSSYFVRYNSSNQIGVGPFSSGGFFVDTDDSIYMADQENDRICRIFPNGSVVVVAGRQRSTTYYSRLGHSLEELDEATFRSPRGLARDRAGNIYVADAYNHRIRKISFAGKGSVTTIAGDGYPGSSDGMGASASFYIPMGIAVGPDDAVYVADWGNYKIRKVAPNGTVSTIAGQGHEGYRDGDASTALFEYPEDVKVDGDGNIFVLDNERLRVITTLGEVKTLVGTTELNKYTRVAGDGPGRSVSFWPASSIALSPSGAIIFADRFNSMVRQVTGNFGLPGWKKGAVPALDYTSPSRPIMAAGLGSGLGPSMSPPPNSGGAVSLLSGNGVANLDTSGLTEVTSLASRDDTPEGLPSLPFDFYFFGVNYGRGLNGKVSWSPNNELCFGSNANQNKISLGYADRRTKSFYYATTCSGLGGASCMRLVLQAYNSYLDSQSSSSVPIRWEMKLVRTSTAQYLEVRAQSVGPTRGTYAFASTNGYSSAFSTFSGPTGGSSFVLQSDLNGQSWTLYSTYHLE